MKDDVLLEINNLTVEFHMFEGIVKAVDNLSLVIKKNRVMGIIGESGSGKSVTAQSILRIVPTPPGRTTTGEILFRSNEGGREKIVNILSMHPRSAEIRKIRGKEISMIFQEPMTSFGPLDTIGRQIAEVITTHEPEVKYEEALQRAVGLLSDVGISRAEKVVEDFPHQLSGGMRQRAMIAMGLACHPRLLLADEPTTALDVTVQAQILSLLRELQVTRRMSMIYITHNLAVVSEIADDITVMYLGNMCESGDVNTIVKNPLHPYTQALWKSIPGMVGEITRLEPIAGTMPSMSAIPKGCVFCTRCEHRISGLCDGDKRPEPVEVENGHWVNCFLYQKN
ncbi:dipeptide/oligopeptide/nickel ABC transporter ATP-binding protein [Spirochaetia bacterium]|nr:dipeptide/oligopeptide/nickel ABC transporter ATP-binding protein [Spirochaetia bacterium]